MLSRGCGRRGVHVVGGVGFGTVLGFVLGIGGVGVGWEEIVVVGCDRCADGVAPAVGAEGVDVFVLGQAGGLH